MKFLGKHFATPSICIDTQGYNRLQAHNGDSNLMLYILMMFISSLLLYFGTKNWNGLTPPVELDLGAVPTQPRLSDSPRVTDSTTKQYHVHRPGLNRSRAKVKDDNPIPVESEY